MSLLGLSLPQSLWKCQNWRLLQGNSSRIRRRKENYVAQLSVPIFKNSKEDSTKNPQEMLIALCLYGRIWSFPSRLLICPHLFLARAGVSQCWVTTLSTGCISSSGRTHWLLTAVSCLSQAAFQGQYLPVIKGFAFKFCDLTDSAEELIPLCTALLSHHGGEKFRHTLVYGPVYCSCHALSCAVRLYYTTHSLSIEGFYSFCFPPFVILPYSHQKWPIWPLFAGQNGLKIQRKHC